MQIIRELSDSYYFQVGNAPLTINDSTTVYPCCKGGNPSGYLVAVVRNANVDFVDVRELGVDGVEFQGDAFTPETIRSLSQVDWRLAVVLAREKKVLQDIKTQFPYAIKANRSNVQVGDLLCNHKNVPLLLVTEDVLLNEDSFQYWYIVGSTVRQVAQIVQHSSHVAPVELKQ
ncbi:hypothetical protein [Vibrio agarivorans]|uniref:Uncharacterized protein n=1 Tax=Vibrio agarivorans TaxID=153622 RepID=A0ABT7Y763_9VIBR|nr:hypothetical protein [Vibrio agarivorans]MDN2483842.1 hypothetical protein [Vibrio agarivorans]